MDRDHGTCLFCLPFSGGDHAPCFATKVCEARMVTCSRSRNCSTDLSSSISVCVYETLSAAHSAGDDVKSVKKSLTIALEPAWPYWPRLWQEITSSGLREANLGFAEMRFSTMPTVGIASEVVSSGLPRPRQLANGSSRHASMISAIWLSSPSASLRISVSGATPLVISLSLWTTPGAR
eukprot:2556317-Prymnesium_polylepis.1